MTVQPPLEASEYDAQWRLLDDFTRYNPGARHRRRWIFRLLKEIEFSSILDVGCGNGELIGELHARFGSEKRYYGIDLSAETIAKNASRFPFAEFAAVDIEHESLPQDFQLVICSEVLEHLSNRPRAFQQLTSMVRSGGHLLVTVPAGRVYETERRWGHTTHPTRSEIMELAEANRLQVVQLLNWGWPVYTALKFITNLRPNWSVKHFGSGAYTRSAKAISTFIYLCNFCNRTDSSHGCQIFALLRKP